MSPSPTASSPADPTLPAITDLLATLVAFETVSSATNLPLVDHVEAIAGATAPRSSG